MTEKIPIYNYHIPNCAKAVMEDKDIVCVETMDNILFDCLGIHFLEPQVSFDIKTKVKPAITKTKANNSGPAEALSYMKKAEKKQEGAEVAKKGTAMSGLSAAEKRKLDMEVKPKINLALKLQVTKQDLKNRPHFQEVAEVFEEMLQAVDKGLNYLPPRLNRAPGQV